MARLMNYLTGWRRWLFIDARDLWWSILVPIGATLAIPFFPQQLEVRIRWAGLVVQLAGTLVAVGGLLKTRRQFNRPNYFAALWDRRPRWPKSATIVAGVGRTTLDPMTARAHGTSKPPAGATLEQRVDLMQVKLEELDKAVFRHSERVEKQLAEHGKRLDQESAARAQGDHASYKLIDEVAAGGLVWAWIGLVWIVYGTILSTVSQELACWFGR